MIDRMIELSMRNRWLVLAVYAAIAVAGYWAMLRTPIDAIGPPRSEGMPVTERYRRRDIGPLDVEITFDDPQFYTRPVTVRIGHYLVPDNDIFEMFCTQNEKDRSHMVK